VQEPTHLLALQNAKPRTPGLGITAATVLDANLIFRVGLAVLFLANALIAWVDPDQFRNLVVNSGTDRLVPPELVIWGIRANDLVLGILLLVGVNRWPRLIPAWAGLYLLGVSVIKLAAL
jgi:hypothetical protein